MSLGIKPGPKSVRGKHLSNLPLLRMVDFDEYKKHAHEHEVHLEYARSENSELRARIQELEGSWWQRFKKKTNAWWRSPGSKQTEGVRN